MQTSSKSHTRAPRQRVPLASKPASHHASPAPAEGAPTLAERSETKPWAEEEAGNSGGWWVGEQKVGGLNFSMAPHRLLAPQTRKNPPKYAKTSPSTGFTTAQVCNRPQTCRQTPRRQRHLFPKKCRFLYPKTSLLFPKLPLFFPSDRFATRTKPKNRADRNYTSRTVSPAKLILSPATSCFPLRVSTTPFSNTCPSRIECFTSPPDPASPANFSSLDNSFTLPTPVYENSKTRHPFHERRPRFKNYYNVSGKSPRNVENMRVIYSRRGKIRVAVRGQASKDSPVPAFGLPIFKLTF